MDFINRPRKKLEKPKAIVNLEQLYPHNLNLYRVPPTEEITLREFEDLALERLKFLRIFQLASDKGLRLLSDEWKELITAEINREGLKSFARLFHFGGTAKEADLQARRKDHISHFILRVAYSGSSELQRWFLSREMELFRYKFSQMDANQIEEFLDLNSLEYTPLTEEQKNEVKDGLYESTAGQSAGKVELMNFYKVHFTEVLDLVKFRRCFLKAGYAYVGSNDFISIIAARYQAELERGLNVAQRSLRDSENDERLTSILRSLHTSYTGKDYSIDSSENVPIESLDQLSKKSFPLCMRACLEHMRTKHHLKHDGRFQFQLFLKGIGVIMEDTIRFFREEFTKIMDADQFEKRYVYNIRHSYGKEGSMTKYTPFSCIKVIAATAGLADAAGCPYRQLDSNSLKTRLTNYGLSATHVQEVANYASKGHYQIACSRYFEIVHETKYDQGINHPNHYFEMSQIVMGNRKPKTNEARGGKNAPRRPVIKKEGTLMEGDDDELWNIAETQENLYSQNASATRNEWDDDDFDVSQVENI